MKLAWIAFLILCMSAPAGGQSSDTVESSGKVQLRKARDAGKTVSDEKRNTRDETGRGAPASPGVRSDGAAGKKPTGREKKAFIDENGDGVSDNALTGSKRSSRATGRTGERAMDRFSDPDGDGINEGRGFGRDRGKKTLEHLKEKNNFRERNGK